MILINSDKIYFITSEF